MKAIWSYFLFFTIVILSFKDVVTFLTFKYNQPYISKYLCINRNNQNLHCNGKCFLMQKLNKEKGQQSELPSKKNEQNPNLYFIVTSQHLLPSFFIPKIEKLSFGTIVTLSSNYLFQLLKPPK